MEPSEHVPVGRLPDGALLFAPLGELVAVEGGDGLVCHACGDALAHLSRAHLDRHGMSLSEYRERFGLNRKQSLLSPSLADRRRVEGRRRLQEVSEVREGLAAGQAMARVGVLNQIGVAAQSGGVRRRQGARSRAEQLSAAREAQALAARARHEQRARDLGFDSLLELLQCWYVQQRRPISGMGADLGVGATQVRRLLAAFNVPTRPGRARTR